jgi:hypothetical protein
MITLFIIGLAGTGIAFAAVPVIAYALMLETCADRAAVSARSAVTAARAPRASSRRPFLAAA